MKLLHGEEVDYSAQRHNYSNSLVPRKSFFFLLPNFLYSLLRRRCLCCLTFPTLGKDCGGVYKKQTASLWCAHSFLRDVTLFLSLFILFFFFSNSPCRNSTPGTLNEAHRRHNENTVLTLWWMTSFTPTCLHVLRFDHNLLSQRPQTCEGEPSQNAASTLIKTD